MNYLQGMARAFPRLTGTRGTWIIGWKHFHGQLPENWLPTPHLNIDKGIEISWPRFEGVEVR